MTDLEAALLSITTDFRALKVRWALVGGWAVSLRAVPRTTHDVDVTIAVAGDEEAQRLAFEMRGRGYRLRPNSQIEQTATDRLATVRLLSPPEGRVVVDLLFASSGIEGEIVDAATPLEVLKGVHVPVALTGHLLALKVLAGRAQDLADIESLLRFADVLDLKLARESLTLIADRGYDRGKDLEAEAARLFR
jgi:hypothetical protein